jgi:hypothetical protein
MTERFVFIGWFQRDSRCAWKPVVKVEAAGLSWARLMALALPALVSAAGASG